MSNLVHYEIIEDWIALVTLNRPEKRNAINPELAQALEAAVKRSESDDMVRAVILTSSNDKTFCAGADLKAVSEGRGRELYTADGGFGGLVEAQRRKPWIAAITGSALAGGMELSLACDMIVAAQATLFGLPEAKRGLVAAAGGISRLPKAIPRNLAMELIATGDPIDAARAYDLGLVNTVTPAGKHLEGALDLARRIVVNAPLAVQEGIGVAKEAVNLTDEAGMRLADKAVARLRGTEDYQEGPLAFIEKRAPVWKGR